MKPKRYTTEQIIRILQQTDGDHTVDSIYREHNISKAFPIDGGLKGRY